MDLDSVVAYARKNKAASLLALILLLIFLSAIATILSGFQRAGLSGISADNYAVSGAQKSMSESLYSRAGGHTDSVDQQDSGAYVEVKEGSMSIETENADNDAADIRSLTESQGGYIETMRKYDTSYDTRISLRARLPSDNFQGFVDALKDRYDEKSFTISFYRVSTQRELNELDVLGTAFTNFELLRNRTMMISLDEKQIDLLFRITEKELELKRLEKQYSSSLSSKQMASEYATLNIELQQTKSISIMPENLGNRLRNKAKSALDNIANSLMDIVTGSAAVFVSAVKLVVYLILFAIPVLIGYRVLKRVYGRIIKA